MAQCKTHEHFIDPEIWYSFFREGRPKLGFQAVRTGGNHFGLV